jgi:mRNA-degrading endonuclease RelE of RelBE toxin-antitoxin system
MKIHIKKSARKELMKLPDIILIKTFKTVLSLGENPYPRGYDKVEGKENQLRLWIDKNYRILYEVVSNKSRLDIVAIRHKSERTYK